MKSFWFLSEGGELLELEREDLDEALDEALNALGSIREYGEDKIDA